MKRLLSLNRLVQFDFKHRVYNHFGDENEKVKDVISFFFFFDKLKDVTYFTIIVNILDNNSTCDKLTSEISIWSLELTFLAAIYYFK